MTTQTTDDAVRTSVTVEVPIERAFTVFTDEIDSWWDPDHHLIEAEFERMVFEPRVGGHLYDVGVDGSECRWARVLAFDPPDRFVISWDINTSWDLETDLDARARSRCGSSPRARAGPGSSSSTATSIGTARAGRSRCGTRSPPRRAGRLGCGASRRAPDVGGPGAEWHIDPRIGGECATRHRGDGVCARSRALCGAGGAGSRSSRRRVAQARRSMSSSSRTKPRRMATASPAPVAPPTTAIGMVKTEVQCTRSRCRRLEQRSRPPSCWSGMLTSLIRYPIRLGRSNAVISSVNQRAGDDPPQGADPVAVRRSLADELEPLMPSNCGRRRDR